MDVENKSTKKKSKKKNLEVSNQVEDEDLLLADNDLNVNGIEFRYVWSWSQWKIITSEGKGLKEHEYWYESNVLDRTTKPGYSSSHSRSWQFIEPWETHKNPRILSSVLLQKTKNWSVVKISNNGFEW